MLTRIMEILARKESLSLAQLAEEVGNSVREIEGLLNHLEQMGFIRRELLGQVCGLSCDSEQGSSRCEGCGSRPIETYTFWMLTERGEHLVSSKLK